MQGLTSWMLLGVFFLGFTSCSIICPDGSSCPDKNTCCFNHKGYRCCPYPDAVCCADKAHCCPSGFRCNMVTKMCVKANQPWIMMPMVEKDPAEPSYPASEDKEDKEVKETPVTSLTEVSEGPHEVGVIRCDSKFYCAPGTSCCKKPTGQWSCCPYPLGKCCADGLHCCQYGYTCDPSSLTCRTYYSQVPSGRRQRAKTADF